MSINKFNAEHYPDTTAYEALSVIEQAEREVRIFRPIVFICSPYAGDIENNVKAAQKYCRFAVEMGYIPFAPHLLFPQFLNDTDPKERDLGLFFGIALMSKCAELWVFGETVSAGMAKEIEKAEKRGMRIRRFNSNCEEVQVK
jgi:hypothetical protein